MSIAAQSDFTCTTIRMSSDIGKDKPVSRSPRSREDRTEMHAPAWAKEETESSVAEEESWSVRGLGIRTSQDVHIKNGDTKAVTDNTGHSLPIRENGLHSDTSSPDSKLNKSDTSKTPHAKKLKYLSQCPSTPSIIESRIQSHTSLLPRDRTFHQGQAQSLLHWEGSQGALSRHNTSFSSQNDGKHPKTQNGSKHWEGAKSVDGHPHSALHRQKTIPNGHDQCAQHVTPSFEFSRGKTVASIPSKGLQAKAAKRDPSSLHLSTSMMVRGITSVSDMDLTKKPSRAIMQMENEAPRSTDIAIHHKPTERRTSITQNGPKLEFKVPKASVPKTGLIKLTALQDEQNNPALYDEYLRGKEGSMKNKINKRHGTTNHMKFTGSIGALSNSKFTGGKVRPVPLSHKRLVTKQKELIQHQHEGETKEQKQDWRSEITENRDGFTFEDLQRGILDFDMPVPHRRKASPDPDQAALITQGPGDGTTHLPPLEIPSPRENILPPIRT